MTAGRVAVPSVEALQLAAQSRDNPMRTFLTGIGIEVERRAEPCDGCQDAAAPPATAPEDDLEGPILASVGLCDGTWQQLNETERADWRAWLRQVGAEANTTCCVDIYTEPPRVRLHQSERPLRLVGPDGLDVAKFYTTIDLLPRLPAITP